MIRGQQASLQDKFCGLRLRGKKTSYEVHCRGEASEHFAPPCLIQITLHYEAKLLFSEPAGELGDLPTIVPLLLVHLLATHDAPDQSHQP